MFLKHFQGLGPFVPGEEFFTKFMPGSLPGSLRLGVGYYRASRDIQPHSGQGP